MLFNRPGRKFSTSTSDVGGEAPEHFAPVLVLEIQRDAALVAVEAQEVAAAGLPVAVADDRRARTRAVALAGALDLDDLGPLVGEHHGAVRTGDLDLETQDLDAVERSSLARGHGCLLHAGHRLSTTVAMPWPPPMHKLATPWPPPRRRSSCTSVVSETTSRVAERVAERDRAAVDIEPVLVDRELGEAAEHLRGEGFVDLDQVDVIGRQPGAIERLRDGVGGPEAHHAGIAAGDRRRHDPRLRLRAHAVQGRLATRAASPRRRRSTSSSCRP